MGINAPSTRAAGDIQEARALDHFTALGWSLVRKNYRCKAGEIDLIFKDRQGVVVFMEVKYRSSSGYGTAQEAVDGRKQQRIVKSALYFIKENGLQGRDLRFDVAAMTPAGLEHIPNAFSAEGYSI